MNERRAYTIFFGILFIALLLLFIYSVAEILLLFFVSILFAIYLAWVTESLQRRLGIPRWSGLVAALAITAVAATAIGYLIIPPLIEQTQELIRALPGQLTTLETHVRTLTSRSQILEQLLPPLQTGESYTGNLLKQAGEQLRGLVPVVFGGVGFVIHLISVLIMGVYLALRPAIYREGFIVLAPPVHRELVRDILGDLGRTLRAWIVGQILAMMVLGIFTWIGLEILQVPYALAFGVFSGVAAIVPFFGTLVSTLLPALFVISTGGFTHFIAVALLGVVVHIIEANVVAPMIMERQVHLPPVLSILSVLIMGHLLHIVGLLVAVPVLTTVMVITRRVYVHRVLEGKGFRRAIRDKAIEIHLPEPGMVVYHPLAMETSLPALLEE
jgi:predicted PurR-regulated permease PerM